MGWDGSFFFSFTFTFAFALALALWDRKRINQYTKYQCMMTFFLFYVYEIRGAFVAFLCSVCFVIVCSVRKNIASRIFCLSSNKINLS